jgi:hypothetical protein
MRTNLPGTDPLLKFVNESAFAQNGGIVTDLDGTALHEDAGRVNMHLLRNGICRSRCTIFRFDEKQLFLEGYGLSSRQISAISPVLKALTRINYRPEVQRALNPKNAAQLERYRARLAGRFDLSSL